MARHGRSGLVAAGDSRRKGWSGRLSLLFAPILLGAWVACVSPAPPAVSAGPTATAATPGVVPPGAAKSACAPLGQAQETIEVDQPGPGELHEVLEIRDEPALWDTASPDEALERYRAAVSARLGGKIAPKELLAAQRSIYEAFPGGAGEAANGAALLEGRTGAIGPIRCLELLLWRRQAARYPMLEHPTEFGAYILRSKDRVRVYFSSADRVGQKLRSEVRERAQADRKAGFEVVAHLHNHPFLFDRVVGDRMWTTADTVRDVAGAVAPSKADVQALRAMRESVGLQGAWVTNGLDTARFRADELDALVAAE